MRFNRRFATAFLASTILASASARAQDTSSGEPEGTAAKSEIDSDRGDIVVTAQRRAENLQDVPVAITAITTKTLEDLQVDQFEDYAKLVPSLSFKSAGPGFANVYFRGVASGENANHSASLPSVGTYLDEQPITTITGALDIHVFDIARVEALAGPQGTLYGASSQAGTIRIITNKPDMSSTYGAVNAEINSIAHGGIGYTGEGFVNMPIADNIATRIVGWYRKDAGWIDNVPGTLSFPTSGLDFSNDEFVEDDYNDVETYGARAALRIELNDRWTVTPQIMAQKQVSNGSFAEESGLDDYETMQFNPERFVDKWAQASLTVEGKLGNFDMTYAGAYMRRQIDGESDYVDYGYFYDALFGYGVYWYDNDGDLIVPNQFIQSDDSFTKQSHELRFTSPGDQPVRLVGGLFYQRQSHNIEQNYIIPGIADFVQVEGTNDNIWLTKQLRVDRDYAIFGEVAIDMFPKFTLTVGGRLYRFDNSLEGFFGFNYFDPDDFDGNPGYSSNPQYNCELFGPSTVDGAPCNNVDKRTRDNGFVHRVNGTYKVSDDALVYATMSRGFRPGGINRRGILPPYAPDVLDNYEAGAKISFGNGSHFNFAVYQLDWSNIQLSFLGANGLTEIRNAGDARIRGFEADLLLRPATGLSWGTGLSFNDAKLTNPFCKIANRDFDCSLDRDLDGDGELEENSELAPNGTRLPLSARWKLNSRVRYEWMLMPDTRAHVQASYTFEGKRRRDLRTFENALYGNLDSYSLVDAAAGVDRGPWSLDLYVKNLFDARGQISRGIQCTESTCGDPDGVTDIGGKLYTVISRPRTVGLRVGRKF
ncbi:MAG: TonB-dependent receptor [Pseudomonadota bacterium]|nr:TonB-dependent receptor [Pseudomonadota bacterium]